MDTEAFKLELVKSQKKTFKIGLISFLLFSGVCALIIIFVGFSDRSAIIGLSLFGVFVVIGPLMMITSSCAIKKIKAGDHELLRAKNELITKKNKSYTLVLYTIYGKPIRYMVKEESKLIEMIEFLASKFPEALVGFTEETRIEASNIVGQEIKKTFF